jgi:hypothetical protein
VEHRHLLPDEINLLVDGEEGFGVAPLAAHVEACARCRAEVEAQGEVVRTLERLPHLSPSPLFAHRVMSQVRVFEPWHVTARDTLLRYVPRTRPMRIAAGAVAGVAATVLTVATFWAFSRIDAIVFLLNVASAQVREGALGAGGALLGQILGDATASAVLAGGGSGLAMLASAFLGLVVLAAFGLRAVATSSHRGRT